MPAALEVNVRVDGEATREEYRIDLTPVKVEPKPWSLEATPPGPGAFTRVCAPGTYRLTLAARDDTWIVSLPEELRLPPGKRTRLNFDVERFQREVRFLDAEG